MADTLVEEKQSTKTQTSRLQHIVELDDQGQPLDVCLCGYIWDMLLRVKGPMCRDCLREFNRRRGI